MVYSQSSILALGLWLCTASAQAQVGMTGEAPVGESVSPVDGVSSDGEKASDAEGDTSVVVERREVIQKCIEAHENAQLENLESHLLKQREWLLRCAELECPGSIRLDCSSWLESNQRETPSIQILVRDQYGASLEAVATIDSIGPVPIESTIELNPGSYRVAIAANGRHYERRVSLVARERGRLISFTIVDAKE